MLAPLVLLTVFLCPTVAPAEGEKPAGDLGLLQGRWKAWLEDDVCLTFEIRGKEFTLARQEGMQQLPAWNGLLLVEEKSNPKQLSWVSVKSGDRALPDNLCVYELHGDTWLLIGGGPDKRPSKFISGEGNTASRTLVLKREKTEAEEPVDGPKP